MENQTHVIEVGKGFPEKSAFEDWLREKGHEVDRATGSKSWVDGDCISKSPEAREIFINLLGEFKKEHQNG